MEGGCHCLSVNGKFHVLDRFGWQAVLQHFISVKFSNDLANTEVISYFIHNVEWLTKEKKTLAGN